MQSINVDNYQTVIDKFGVANLTPTLKEGHEYVLEGSQNFESLNELKEMMEDPDIGEVIEMYFKKLQRHIESSKPQTPKPPQQAKPKPKRKPSAKQKPKAKPAARKTRAPKSKAPRSKAPEVKPPIVRTIKSPELVVITRALNLSKKPRTVLSIQNFAKQIANAQKANRYIDHKTLVDDIRKKLNEAITGAEKNNLSTITFEMSEDLAKKLQEAKDTSSERFRVSFMAGVEDDSPK